METGLVETFNADGWGTLRMGDQQFAFHSTAIADGTRRIDVGVAVTFVVRPGRQGRWEATQVQAAVS